MKTTSIQALRAILSVLCLCPALTALAQREVYKPPSGEFRTRGVIIKELATASGGKEDRKGKTATGRIIKVIVLSDAKSNFDNILFKLDSTDFQNQKSTNQVKEIAFALKDSRLAGASFLIEGHTCDLGSDAHNEKLSIARADRVKNILIKAGVPQSRLIAIGHGETDPAVQIRPTDDPVSAENKRKHNRRVMVRRVAKTD